MRQRAMVIVAVFVAATGTLLSCQNSSKPAAEPVDASSVPSVAAAATAPAPAPAPTEPTTTTTAKPDEQLGNGNPVTIAFAGDINFEGEMATRLANDPANAIGPFATILSAADLAVANLEAAITEGGTAADKEFVFRTPATAVDALRAAGIDAASLANNHGVDYGLDGLADTLAVKDAQPDGFLIGAGHDDADAYKPFRANVKGQRIAVIAATQVLDGHLIADWTSGPAKPGLASAKRADRLVQAVQEARVDSDTVVVYLHWGIERQECPSANQQTLAQQLADAGADIVVGGHAHVLQGGGRLGNAFVGYGLGNFAFYASGNGTRTGVIQVTITGRRVDAYQFVPGRISARVPRPLEGAEATDALAYWESLRACTNLTP